MDYVNTLQISEHDSLVIFQMWEYIQIHRSVDELATPF